MASRKSADAIVFENEWDDYGRIIRRPHRHYTPRIQAPPPPPEPTAAEIQAYHADTADAVERRSGVPLPNLDVVEAALRMFATNRYRLSEATEMNQMPALGAVYYGLATAGRGMDPFLDRLIKEVRSVFDGTAKHDAEYLRRDENRKAYFYRSWDRDGPGSFFKAILTITQTTTGFDLSVWQSYHGSACDLQLAEAFGTQSHLNYATYTRTFIGEGETFAIPLEKFGAILGALGSSEDPRAIAQELVTHQMAKIRTIQDHPREYRLPVEGPAVWMEIDTGRLDREMLRHREADLAVTDAAITGPARVHDNGRPYAVGLQIRLSTDHTPGAMQPVSPCSTG